MRIPQRSRTRGGFTLVELMIVVALIGTMAAIAIPNFMTYQARSRRAEGYSNLASLARSYVSYAAEKGAFPDMLATSGEPTLPKPSDYGGLGTKKMPWDAPTTSFFDVVGWQSEGSVYYSYDVNSTTGCSCSLCFTTTAHGDVDGDGFVSALMYVHPQRDSAGAVTGECPSRVFAYGPPIRPETGDSIYDEVTIQATTDNY